MRAESERSGYKWDDTIDHFKRHDLLLAEKLTTIPAVVTSLSEGEANRAARAAVHHLVLHPVVGRWTTRLVADRPAEDSTTSVTHKDLAVVPITTMNRGQILKNKRRICIVIWMVIFLTWRWQGMWSQLGEHCPCGQTQCAWWVYSWRPAGAPICTLRASRNMHSNQKTRTTNRQQMNIFEGGVFCEATVSILVTELRSQSEFLL